MLSGCNVNIRYPDVVTVVIANSVARNLCPAIEAGDTTYSERVCVLCYIGYGAGSGNRTRTASSEGWR